MPKIALAIASVSVVMALNIPVEAKPVEYVKICSTYGVSWYVIPGTNTCLNPQTGETKEQVGPTLKVGETPLAAEVSSQNAELQSATARFNNDFREELDGSAIAMALDSPFLSEGEHFGVKVNWGTYQGSNAVGLTFAGVLAERANDRVILSGGVAYTGRDLGVHAGVQFSW